MNNLIKIGLILTFFINSHALVLTDYVARISSYNSTFIRYNGVKRDYYFHAIAVNVYRNGSYNFTSQSSFDMYGSFHYFPTDSTNLSKSLISDDYDNNHRFQINVDLQSQKTYVLIVSTYYPNVTGFFRVRVEGPTNVQLDHNDYFIVESTTSSKSILLHKSISPIFILATVSSTNSDFLSSDNLQFNRPTSNSANHYYQTIEIIPPMNGTYIFLGSASFDISGYLYENFFNSQYSYFNLIEYNDDDDGENTHFRINVTLQFQRKYTQ
ncbi:hypothetical protein I4U23_027339 [Adineta vaga]|nr:hypothetical protein I4U23_027339 [Adineta vaga]